MDKVTLGRIVHWVPDEGHLTQAHQAAIVTEVGEPTGTSALPDVELMAFPSRALTIGPPFQIKARYSADMEPGTWHWPERA
jgi:hypothetical protein